MHEDRRSPSFLTTIPRYPRSKLEVELRLLVKWSTVHKVFFCHMQNIFGGGNFPKNNGSRISGCVLFEEDQQGVIGDYVAGIICHDHIMSWIPWIMMCYNLNTAIIKNNIKLEYNSPYCFLLGNWNELPQTVISKVHYLFTECAEEDIYVWTLSKGATYQHGHIFEMNEPNFYIFTLLENI